VVTDSYPRNLGFSATYNFRDVGGYTGLDGRTVRWRRLFRSDALHRLGEADTDAFAALGVRTVIDLRRPFEIERFGRVAERYGLDHIDLGEFPVDESAAALLRKTAAKRYIAAPVGFRVNQRRNASRSRQPNLLLWHGIHCRQPFRVADSLSRQIDSGTALASPRQMQRALAGSEQRGRILRIH